MQITMGLNKTHLVLLLLINHLSSTLALLCNSAFSVKHNQLVQFSFQVISGEIHKSGSSRGPKKSREKGNRLCWYEKTIAKLLGHEQFALVAISSHEHRWLWEELYIVNWRIVSNVFSAMHAHIEKNSCVFVSTKNFQSYVSTGVTMTFSILTY